MPQFQRPEGDEAIYNGTLVSETTEIQTPAGKAIAMPGTYIFDDGTTKFVVAKADAENANLWVAL